MPLFNPQTSVTVPIQTSSTGTIANLSVGTSASQIAADAGRKGLSITNKSAVSVYVHASAGTPTASSNMVELVPGAYFEFPQPIYTGIISIAAASGTVNNVQAVIFT